MISLISCIKTEKIKLIDNYCDNYKENSLELIRFIDANRDKLSEESINIFLDNEIFYAKKCKK